MTTETRKKIQKAAVALGYHPNPLLAALASKHFGSKRFVGTPLAYIHSPELNPDAEGPMQKLLRHTQEHAKGLGYFLELFNVSDFKNGAHATQVLFSRGVQGIILPHQFQLKMLPGMDWSRFSVVGFGESTVETPDSPQPVLYRSAVDHSGVILRAWNETWKRGYRRIGFALLVWEAAIMDDQLRWSATQFCLQRIPRRLRIPPFVVKAKKDFNFQKFRPWMDRYRPDAVLGFNETFGWLLVNEGFRVPQDVGFASLHTTPDSLFPRSKDCTAGMKTMDPECLLAAVELVDQQIRHHQYGLSWEPRTLMIHSKWIDGETLPSRVP